MDFEDCVKFANEHPICSFATVDGEQPQLRIVGLWFADKDGFCFSTQTYKPFYRQLSERPNVAVCFYAPPSVPLGQEGSMDMGTQMRVTGTAEFLSDQSLKERLLAERPFLRPFADVVVIFRVTNGEAWFWTFADAGREAEIERVQF